MHELHDEFYTRTQMVNTPFAFLSGLNVVYETTPTSFNIRYTRKSILLIHVPCVSVCLCPARCRERNVVSPRTFRQSKGLLLASCTNCLMSLLLERKVVNAPFAFLCGFNIRRTKPHPPRSTYDMTCETCNLLTFTRNVVACSKSFACRVARTTCLNQRWWTLHLPFCVIQHTKPHYQVELC